MKFCQHCGSTDWDAFAYAWLEVGWFIAYGEERGSCAHEFIGRCAYGCGSLAHPASKRGFCWTHHVEYPLNDG